MSGLERVKAHQAQNKLTDSISKNHRSLLIMAPEEFLDFCIKQKKSRGMSSSQAAEWLDSIVKSSNEIPGDEKQRWDRYKDRVKEGGSFLPVFFDARTLAVLTREMHKGGHILSKYRVNTYGGRSYVVLQGYAGLRSQLTGTRYLANNPKILHLGIGKLGALNAIKSGVGIAVIFSVAFHSIEQFMNDKATWHDFVAGVSVDVASATAGAAIAWGTVAAVVGGTAMAAIGPIALVVVVGTGLTAVLNAVSAHYSISERLARLLRESEQRMLQHTREIKREFRRGLNYADEDPVGFIHRLFGLPYLGGVR
ncbi:hypothetical protein QQM79_20875 [Marinobacteraceae bacterium S3BR75-40.1]